MSEQAARKRLRRRWRKLDAQPRSFIDWPDQDYLAVETAGDPILVYDRCNGYSLWFEGVDCPPPAEFWMALPDRDSLYDRPSAEPR